MLTANSTYLSDIAGQNDWTDSVQQPIVFNDKDNVFVRSGKLLLTSAKFVSNDRVVTLMSTLRLFGTKRNEHESCFRSVRSKQATHAVLFASHRNIQLIRTSLVNVDARARRAAFPAELTAEAFFPHRRPFVFSQHLMTDGRGSKRQAALISGPSQWAIRKVSSCP
uniref:Uncharacterized protein n=1 Tax=Steinernema glaseri TaxID=37863 RepID=A0A1I7Y5Y8_9BILA